MDRLSGLHELRLAHLPHVGCGLIEALVGRAAQQQQEGGLRALQVRCSGIVWVGQSQGWCSWYTLPGDCKGRP